MTPLSTNQSAQYVQILVDTLLPFAEVKIIQPNRRLYFNSNNTNYCYFIMDGLMGVYSDKNDLMLGAVTPPSLYGLSRLVSQDIDFYLKTITRSTIGKMPLELTEKLISEHNLWETVSKFILAQSGKLYTLHKQVTAPSAYEIVRTQLLMLMREKPDLRLRMTAELYIRNKTTLSRSRVMQVLSDLNKGGYIKLERGVLIDVYTIPEKY